MCGLYRPARPAEPAGRRRIVTIVTIVTRRLSGEYRTHHRPGRIQLPRDAFRLRSGISWLQSWLQFNYSQQLRNNCGSARRVFLVSVTSIAWA